VTSFPVLFGPDLLQRLKGQIRIDRFGAIARQHAEMVHFARFAGLDHQAGLHSQALPNEVMVHRRGCEQGRHRNAICALRAVREDQDVTVLQYAFGRVPAHFP